MAKLEQKLNGNFYSIAHKISDGIVNGSVSAHLKTQVILKTEMLNAVFGYLRDIVLSAVTE